MTGMMPEPMRLRESRHRQCPSRRFSRDFFDPYPTSANEAAKNINGQIHQTKGTYWGSGQNYEIHAIDVDAHRRRQFQSRLHSTRLDGVLYVTDDVRSLLQRLRKSYAMIQLWIPISFVYWLAEFKIVEQRSQIVWQLRMGSIITPSVLKWLAGTICDYHCQLSQSAPDWTTESDPCQERESHLRQLYSISPNIPQRANTDVPIGWHTKRILGLQWRFWFVAGILGIHGATGGWTVWALSRDQRIPHVFKVQRGSLDVSIPTWEWSLFDCQQSQLGEARTAFGCQTVRIGCDMYVIRSVILFVHMVAAAVDTLWAGEW